MKKCVRCGIYFDEADNETSGSALCSVCRAVDSVLMFRVRHISTERYLRVAPIYNQAGTCCQVVLRWCDDKSDTAMPRDVAEAFAKSVMHAMGDLGVEIEPVEN